MPESMGMKLLRWVAPGTHSFVLSRTRRPSAFFPEAFPGDLSVSRTAVGGAFQRIPGVGDEASPVSSTAVPPASRTGLIHFVCLFYTWALLAGQTAEFLSGGRMAIAAPLGSIYLAVLAAYVGDKELGLWTTRAEAVAAKKRKGEWFVAVWAVFAMIVCTAAGLWPRFAIPRELTVIVIEVIAVFFGSRVSMHVRQARRLGKTLEADGLETSLEAEILSLLAAGAPLSSQQIIARTGASRRWVQKTLARLVLEGKVLRVSANATDPDTRYRLA